MNHEDRILKEFQLFVAMFNSINDTTYNVESALEDERLTNLFTKSRNKLIKEKTTQSINSLSTKSRSYQQLNSDTVDGKVYSALLGLGCAVTRNEIQNALDIKIQTLTGAITRLKKSGLIRVVGEHLDPETKRSVQLLVAVV